MAERRMFAKTIIDSDAFLDMPLSAQALYFHLSMRADDDGFINNPKKIQRMIGASDDDARLLIAKQFIIPFKTGVVVIKHWKIHNYIRNDRYKATIYTNEKELLVTEKSGEYSLGIPSGYQTDTVGIPDGYQMDTQDRIVKYSVVKSKDIMPVSDEAGEQPTKPKRSKRFTPPEVEEVAAYCEERKNGIDAQHFVDYYEARGWMIGKNRMKDWKAAVRTWERNRDGGGTNGKPEKPAYDAGAFGTIL